MNFDHLTSPSTKMMLQLSETFFHKHVRQIKNSNNMPSTGKPITWKIFSCISCVISPFWVSNAETEYCARHPKDCNTVGTLRPICRDSTSPWTCRQHKINILKAKTWVKFIRKTYHLKTIYIFLQPQLLWDIINWWTFPSFIQCPTTWCSCIQKRQTIKIR